MKRTLSVLSVVAAAIVTAGLLWPLAAQEEKKKRDGAAPLGPTTRIEFDTSEGTWMNVDVSPDGRLIVFDLLGDLYVMPIEGTGGKPATRITEGPAFDMQPRFSPDGRTGGAPSSET